MQIDREIRGDVTVLHILGKMTLGEGDELLKQELNDLIALGRAAIVLDLGGVPYIDSAGNGEVVRSYTTVTRQGGRLVMCNLTKRIEDLWAITKILTVFEIYNSVDEAVASFDSARFEVSCPVCRPARWTPFHERITLLSCDVCDARFIPRTTRELLAPLQSPVSAIHGRTVSAHVTHLWWITYYENGFGRESVQLTLGRPSTIAISGRLDLFAFDIIGMAWRSVPAPRRVIFDATNVRVFSPAGRARLEQLCTTHPDGSRAVILTTLKDAAEDGAARLPAGPSTATDRDSALARLGELQQSAQAIDVTIRRR